MLTLTYDPTGTHLTQVADGVGRSVTYGYLRSGDLVTATDVLGRPTTYQYQNHLLTAVRNALGEPLEQTTYDAYTPQGRAITQLAQDGQQLALQYLSAMTVVTTTGTDGQARVTRYGYTANDTLMSAAVDGTSLQEGVTFNDNLVATSGTDANGAVTRVTSTRQGLPQTVEDALGHTTLITYDVQNHPLTVTDSLGRRTVSVYDTANNLLRQTTGITTGFAGFTTIFTYTADNQLQERTGPDGVTTHTEYDGQGQVTAQSLRIGTQLTQTTTFGYDQLGRVVTTTVGLGTPLQRRNVTRYNLDNTVAASIENYQDGIAVATRPSEDVITSYVYDAIGRQIAVIDALGHAQVTHYSVQGTVDWTTQNFVLAGFPSSPLPALPPVYRPDRPDENVSTFIGRDGLGRTVLVTSTGILTGTFNAADPAVERGDHPCHPHRVRCPEPPRYHDPQLSADHRDRAVPRCQRAADHAL